MPWKASFTPVVTVVNGTGYGIKFLGLNNPGDNDWSDNELNGTMADGASVYVKFNTADKGCKWNFKIEWADPGWPGVLWQGIDLCSIDEITLKYDKDDGAHEVALQPVNRRPPCPAGRPRAARLAGMMSRAFHRDECVRCERNLRKAGPKI